jgi:plastocyanin
MERGVPLGCLLIVLLFAGMVCSHAQTAIEGRITLPAAEVLAGTPPRYAAQEGEAASPDPPVAVVYLEGQFPAAATNTPPGTNSVWQRGMQFRPALLPVRVGTTVAFPNGDDFYHNVFSYSKPRRFDLGRYRKEDDPAMQVFDKPGVVKLYCEIHQNMRGIILVLDTPFFTSTDTNGFYQLTNLPPGKYVLKAWADEKRNSAKPVELHTGQTLHADFNLKQPNH